MKRAVLCLVLFGLFSAVSYAEEARQANGVVLQEYLKLPDKPSPEQEMHFLALLQISATIDSSSIDLTKTSLSSAYSLVKLPGLGEAGYYKHVLGIPRYYTQKDVNLARPPAKSFMLRCLFLPLLMEAFGKEESDSRWELLVACIQYKRELLKLARNLERNVFLCENAEYIRALVEKYSSRYEIETRYQAHIESLCAAIPSVENQFDVSLKSWENRVDREDDPIMLQALLLWLWRNVNSSQVFSRPIPAEVSVNAVEKHFGLAVRYINRDFLGNPDSIWEKYYGVERYILKQKLTQSTRMKLFYAFHLLRDAIRAGENFPLLRLKLSFVARGTPFTRGSFNLQLCPQIYNAILPALLDEANRERLIRERESKGPYRLALIREGVFPGAWFRSDKKIENLEGSIEIRQDFLYPTTHVLTKDPEEKHLYAWDCPDINHYYHQLLGNTEAFEWNSAIYHDSEFTKKQFYEINSTVKYKYSRGYLRDLVWGKWNDRCFEGLERVSSSGYNDENVLESFSPCLYYYYKKARYKLYQMCKYDHELDCKHEPRMVFVLVISPPGDAAPETIFPCLVYKHADSWLFRSGVDPYSHKPWNRQENERQIAKCSTLADLYKIVNNSIPMRERGDYVSPSELENIRKETTGLGTPDISPEPTRPKRCVSEAKQHRDHMRRLYKQFCDNPSEEEIDEFYKKLKKEIFVSFGKESYFCEERLFGVYKIICLMLDVHFANTWDREFDAGGHKTDNHVKRKNNVVLYLLMKIVIEEFQKLEHKKTSHDQYRGAWLTLLALYRHYEYRFCDLNSQYQSGNYSWLMERLKEFEAETGICKTYEEMVKEDYAKLNFEGRKIAEKLKSWRASINSENISPVILAAHLEWLAENVSTEFIFPRGIPEQVDTSFLYSYLDFCTEFINTDYLNSYDFSYEDQRYFQRNTASRVLASYAFSFLVNVVAKGKDARLRRKLFFSHLYFLRGKVSKQIFFSSVGKFRKAVVPALQKVCSDYESYRDLTLLRDIKANAIYEADGGTQSFYIYGDFNGKKGHIDFSEALIQPILYFINPETRKFSEDNYWNLLEVCNQCGYLEVLSGYDKPRQPLPLHSVDLHAEFDYNFEFSHILLLHKQGKLQEAYTGISYPDMRRYIEEYRTNKLVPSFLKEYRAAFKVTFPKTRFVAYEVSHVAPLFSLSEKLEQNLVLFVTPDLKSTPLKIEPVFESCKSTFYWWSKSKRKPTNIVLLENSDALKKFIADEDEYLTGYKERFWEIQRAFSRDRILREEESWGNKERALFSRYDKRPAPRE